MGKDKHNPLRKVEKAKRCMHRLKICGVVWFLLAILLVIVGITVLVFFAKYLDTDQWQRGLGITGIVFLLVGIVALSVAIFIIWAFCHLVNRQEKSMASGHGVQHKYHQGEFPADLYPRQPGWDQGSPHHMAGGYPGGDGVQPTAPDVKEPVSPDAIVVEEDTKF